MATTLLDFKSKLLVEAIDKMVEPILKLVLNLDSLRERTLGLFAQSAEMAQLGFQSVVISVCFPFGVGLELREPGKRRLELIQLFIGVLLTLHNPSAYCISMVQDTLALLHSQLLNC